MIDNTPNIVHLCFLLILATVPSAPLQIQVTVGAESGQIWAEWIAPLNDGGDEVDYYTLYILNETSAGGNTTRDALNLTVSSGTISSIEDLALYEPYRVVVSATNKAGEGPLSNASDVIYPGIVFA